MNNTNEIQWKELYASENALRLDHEMEIHFLNNELTKTRSEVGNLAIMVRERDRTIMSLEDQLHKIRNPKKIKYIVCRDFQEYKTYAYELINSPGVEYRYLGDAQFLRGTVNPDVSFIGNWIYNKDINNIISQVRVCTRPVGLSNERTN